MDLIKKYRLIPIDQHQEFSSEHLSDLDRQIQDILKKKINDDEKAKLYAQALQKYVTFPSVNAVKPNLLEEEEQKEKIKNSADVERKILDSVPAKYKFIAQKITNFLKEHRISWTPTKELSVNNEVIAGSDVVELINFLLRSRTRKPIGFEKFQEILTYNNFPQDFIQNTYLNNVKTMYARPNPKRKTVIQRKWLKM